MQDSGKLDQKEYYQLVDYLEQEKKSGSLLLVNEQEQKTFCFKEGSLIFSNSNQKDESFLKWLLDHESVSKEILQELVAEVGQKNMIFQGQWLVANGHLDYTEFENIYVNLTMFRIQNWLDWEKTRYMMVSQLPANFTPYPLSTSFFDLFFKSVEQYAQRSSAFSSGTKFVIHFIEDRKEKLDSLDLDSSSFQKLRKIQSKPSLQIDDQETYCFLQTLKLAGFLELSVKKDHVDTQKQKKTVNLKELQKYYQEIKEKPLFEVLGVTEKTANEGIQRAYLSLARIYHPDRVAKDVTPEVKSLYEKIFGIISNANMVLSDSKLKEEYLADLRFKMEGGQAEDAHKILESEMLFQEGLASIRKGNFEKALDSLKKAIVKYDKEPEYFMEYGWAMYKVASSKNETSAMNEGKKHVKNSVEQNPKLFQAYYYIGMIDKAQDEIESAKKYFEKCLDLNQNFAPALSELRVINMREQKKSSGFFGKFKK